MAARIEIKSKTKRSVPEEPAEEQFGQRRRPEKGPFRLQVDRQTKESYATYEEAAAAGLAITGQECAPISVRSQCRRRQWADGGTTPARHYARPGDFLARARA